MNKKNIVNLSLLVATLIIAGCGSSSENTTPSATQQQTGSETKSSNISSTYQISGENTLNLSLYGNIVQNNIKSITTSRAGTLSALNCQPGTKVSAGSLIATIVPDFNDPTLQNNQTQRTFLGDQIRTLENTVNTTSSNFDTQINQLKNQKENNINQAKILASNLDILTKQKNVSNNDISIQVATVEDQIKTLEDQKKLQQYNKEKDLNKINTSIENQRKQINNNISNYLESVDQVFGITEKNRNKDDAYESYLSSKNTVLKQNVESKFLILSSKLQGISGMGNDALSSFVEEVSNFLKDAADSVNNSSTSVTFTQGIIDTYYSTFINSSNGLLTLKTNLDNSIKSIDTTTNTYDSQITTIQGNIDSSKKNLENLKTNKTSNTDLTVENNINTINGQITNYESSNRNLDNQIEALNQQKSIQLNQLRNQISTMKQNLATLGNSFNGENLYAGVVGTIKEKKVDMGNKVNSNTVVCTISPNDNGSLKLQLYSTQKLPIGQEFEYSKDGKVLGTAKVSVELPYIDAATQNYIYEEKISNSNIKEGDKIDIKLAKKQDTTQIIIPLEYVMPKLDGNYVNKCDNKDCKNPIETKVELGEINNGQVKILSGVNQGEIIGK